MVRDIPRICSQTTGRYCRSQQGKLTLSSQCLPTELCPEFEWPYTPQASCHLHSPSYEGCDLQCPGGTHSTDGRGSGRSQGQGGQGVEELSQRISQRSSSTNRGVPGQLKILISVRSRVVNISIIRPQHEYTQRRGSSEG